MTDTDTYASTVTGGSLKLSHKLNRDDKCITYLLTYRQWQKQHTRKIMDGFRYTSGTITITLDYNYNSRRLESRM